MTTVAVYFKNWVFEVDQELTRQTYQKSVGGGADGCPCDDCKNYVAFRRHAFPDEIRQLFDELGIDSNKEVEISSYETLPNGLHHIGGWFHFKGQIVSGKDCRVPLVQGGYTFDLTKITDNFSIGFSPGSDLTIFEDKADLVQVEFETNIPWVIDKDSDNEIRALVNEG